MSNTREKRLLLLISVWAVSGVICASNATSCFSCPLQTSCVTQRDDYVTVPGIGAYKLHTVAADWDTARRTCVAEGGYLAVPNSVAEANAISTVFENGGTVSGARNSEYACIGFHDRFTEGEFLTIFGQSLAAAGFDNFIPDNPDNQGGSENCGSISKTGLLNDISCAWLQGYVCELASCNVCVQSLK